MSNESVYKVKIEGEGLTFEREVSKELGDRILMLILSGANPSLPSHQVNSSSSTKPKESTSTDEHHADLSIREFLDNHNAKRNPDIITAIGTYLNTHENMQFFVKEDILNAFESAAEPAPKNFSRDLKWAIKVGWVAEKRDTPDTYYVTSSGKNAVNTSFPAELIKRTKGLFSGKKAPSKKNQEAEA
ncbi:MAG: hypothetical protein U0X74_01940 [Anaerolineales bacterium]